MRKTSLLFLFLLFLYSVSAQNLVTNGGFETNSGSPNSTGEYYLATGWGNCNGEGSPDYFSIFGSGLVGLPNCFIGTVNPHSGNACMGEAMYYYSPSDYREYTNTTFSSPMMIGQTYEVSLYVTNGVTSGTYAGGGINKFSIALSTYPLTQSGSDSINITPQLTYNSLLYNHSWQQLTFQFTADSAYKYFTIGNFSNDSNTQFQQFDNCTDYGAYYFFDDISVQNIADTVVARFSVSDTVICQGTCVDFSNYSSANATAYSWSFPGGEPTLSDSINPVVCYNKAGNYDVELIAINGIVSDASLLKNYITVTPLGIAGTIATMHDTVCAGTLNSLQVTGSSGSLQWQSSSTKNNFTNISGATDSSFSQIIFQSTYYRVFAGNGICSDTSAALEVVAIPAPLVDFTWTFKGDTVTFNSPGQEANALFWNFADGDTSNLSNPTHIYDSTGTYHVCLTVTNNTNCNFKFCQDVIIYPLGIINVPFNNNWNIYPDPFANEFYISSPTSKPPIQSIEIYNVLGQVVLRKDFGESRENIVMMDVSTLTNGIYYLKIKTRQQDYMQPVIKE